MKELHLSDFQPSRVFLMAEEIGAQKIQKYDADQCDHDVFHDSYHVLFVFHFIYLSDIDM
jgi:hypothetical protein